MVCLRCKLVVQDVLTSHGISFQKVEIGWAELNSPLTAAEKSKLDADLRLVGLELMEDKARIMTEQIKTEIVAMLQRTQPMRLKLSTYLSEKFGYNYTYLANGFSETEGMTLERYFITQRIERAKELMVYEDMSLADITRTLHFSSVSHLCLQFRKVAGVTPADFRRRWKSGKYVWRSV